MAGIQTPERLFADPAIAEEQAATLAAIQEFAIEPPEGYSSEPTDEYFAVLGMKKPPVLFLPSNRFYEIPTPLDIWRQLEGHPANFLPQVDTTIAASNGAALVLATQRGILHGNLRGAGRTRLQRTSQGIGFDASDLGLHHVEQTDGTIQDTGSFLEVGLIRALEVEITLADATPKEESVVLSDITFKDFAAQGVRTIICKDPSLLQTMLRARETFDPAAQEHLKNELDRVMGKDFYDTIMQVPLSGADFNGGKAFVMQRSAEHHADKRIKADSFRIVLEQMVESTRDQADKSVV